jgi:hypothetical protein
VRSGALNLSFAAASGRASERQRTRTNGEWSHCSHCDRCHAQLARPGSQPHAPRRSDARVLCGDSKSVANPGTIWYSPARVKPKRVTAESSSPNPHVGTLRDRRQRTASARRPSPTHYFSHAATRRPVPLPVRTLLRRRSRSRHPGRETLTVDAVRGRGRGDRTRSGVPRRLRRRYSVAKIIDGR